MAQLLARYRHTLSDKAKVDRIIDHTPEVVSSATAPGDARKLRGIPVAGGACGTILGTDPLHATIRRLSTSARSVTMPC